MYVFTIAKCTNLPSPENGDVKYFNNGQVAVFTCNSGYNLKGPVVIQCNGGTWPSPLPVCVKSP